MRNELLRKKGFKENIDAINQEISHLEAQENRNLIMKHFKTFSEDPEKVNLTQMWKNMKKIWSKFGSNLPTAKKDHNGRIITDPKSLKIC